MRKVRKSRALSATETQRLLGSEPPISVGKLPIDPLGMSVIGSIVKERLVSRGGRPSDPAWTIVRKVPMRPETWSELGHFAQELQEKNIRVSAGQVAAIALERGLSKILHTAPPTQMPGAIVSESVDYEYSLSQDAQLDSDRVVLALTRHKLFQGLIQCA